jgi:hypothetical protein
MPALGLTALGALLCGPAGAAQSALDESAAVKRAELVFAGVVERVEYAFSDDRGGQLARLPHTFVTYRVEDVVRGTAPGATITLRFIGGRGDEARFLMASDLPLFDVGDRDVLFVAGNGEAGCPLVGCANGRLRVIQDHVFSDDGRAVERDGAGALALGAYFDLPEVMTHRVSQTLIVRRDHFEAGEARGEFVASAGGAQLRGRDLLERLRALARTAPAVAAPARDADASQPFSLDPVVAEPAPIERVPAAAPARAGSAQERAELEALRRSGGDPAP